jgi:hypothetical protein
MRITIQTISTIFQLTGTFTLLYEKSVTSNVEKTEAMILQRVPTKNICSGTCYIGELGLFLTTAAVSAAVHRSPVGMHVIGRHVKPTLFDCHVNTDM